MKKNIHKIALALIGSGFGIILLTLIFCDFDFRKFSNEGDYVQRQFETTISTENIEHIQIDAQHTAITIVAGADDQIRIVYDENDAYQYDISTENGVLSMNGKETKHWYDYIMTFEFGYESERKLTLSIPETYAGALDIETSFQGITSTSLLDLQSAKFETEHASLTMQDINTKGDLAFVTSFAPMELKNMVSNGRFAAQNEHGGLQVSQVYAIGASNLKTSFATLDVENLVSEDSIIIANEHGETNINTLNGKALDISTSFGALTASTLHFSEDVTIRNEHHNVELNKVEVVGTLDASTSYGSMGIFATTVGKDANILNEHGSLSLQDVNVEGSLKAETNFADITLQLVKASFLSLIDEHGDIEGSVDGSLVDYAITSEITSNNGENSLPSAKNSGSRSLHASTSYGDIDIVFSDDE